MTGTTSDFDQGVRDTQEAERIRYLERQTVAADQSLVARLQAQSVVGNHERDVERVRRGFSVARSNEDGGHGWSWSQIQSYENDREKWYGRYVKTPRDPYVDTSATTIGNAFHKASEVFANQLAGITEEGTYAGITDPAAIFDKYLTSKQSTFFAAHGI